VSSSLPVFRKENINYDALPHIKTSGAKINISFQLKVIVLYDQIGVWPTKNHHEEKSIA
jgi:hypothetical protein